MIMSDHAASARCGYMIKLLARDPLDSCLKTIQGKVLYQSLGERVVTFSERDYRVRNPIPSTAPAKVCRGA